MDRSRILVSFLVLFFVAPHAGCSGGTTIGADADAKVVSDPWPRGTSWTILIYQHADNNLEPFILQDLGELVGVHPSPNVEIIVQIDRSPLHSSEPIGSIADFTTVKRFRLTAVGLEELADLGELNSSDVGTLADFIHWGITTYPADRYALFLEDHGASWSGFGQDDTSNGDNLTLAELESAIAQGLRDTGLEKFHLVGFDACLMSGFEVASAISSVAHYLVASQDLEPGSGWNYGALAALTDPTRTPLELARAIVDGFKAQYDLTKETEYTLSILDLSEISGLRAAIERFSAFARGVIKQTAPAIALQLSKVETYNQTRDPARASYVVDLHHLMRLVAESSPLLAEVAADVRTAVEALVAYDVRGVSRPNGRGLSIYFPPKRYYRADYDVIAGTSSWRAFIQAFHQTIDETATAPIFLNPDKLAYLTESPDHVEIRGQLDAATVRDVSSVVLTFSIFADGPDQFVLGEKQATLIGAQVIVDYDYSIVELTQGASQTYGYFTEQRDAEGNTTIAIPFDYGPDDIDVQYVEWRLKYDPAGTLKSSEFYGYSETGVAALQPEAGQRLFPTSIVIDAEGNGQSLQTDVSFDAGQPIAVRLATLMELGGGYEVLLLLTAENAKGDLDFVSNSVTLDPQ
ncbi:MAG: hypothetical protein KC609_19565 [Myxococcales bacterium]|nr:hypothetical protein [Myxococcales bacterium]